MSSVEEPRIGERFGAPSDVRRPRLRLHAKILSLVLVAALLPASLISTASYYTARQILVQKSQNELMVHRDSVLSILEDWRGERLAEGVYFAQAEIVTEGLSRRDAEDVDRSDDHIWAYLEKVQEREPLYSDFAVYDRSGRLLTNLRGGSAPTRLTMDGPRFRMLVEQDGVRAAIHQRILDSETRVIGGLLAIRKTDDLWSKVDAGFDLDWGRLRIANADGEMLYGSPSSGSQRPGSEVPFCLDSEVVAGLKSYPDDRGTPWIAAYATDVDAFFCVVLEVEESRILNTVHDLGRRTLAISILGAALVAMFGLLLVRGLLRPIEALIDGADAVAKGELDHQVTTRSRDEIGYLTEVFNLMVRSLRHTYAELEKLSITDALTGLSNRRELDRLFAEELQRALRNESPIAVLMIDIDHFKKVNDRHGHAYGDEVLRELASLLRSELRITDVLARYGGEEFTVLLPGSAREEASLKAEILREACAANAFCGRADGSLTLSIGVAVFPEDGETEEELLAAADGALYRAKETGRDRVVSSPTTRATTRESSP